MSGNGRTALHDVNCYNCRGSSIVEGCKEFDYRTLMALAALIVPLKEGSRKLGLDKNWDSTAGTGNPVDF